VASRCRLGNNEETHPVDFLVCALIGCVTTTTVLNEAVHGIPIYRISTDLEATIDPRRLVGLDEGVPAGKRIVQKPAATHSQFAKATRLS